MCHIPSCFAHTWQVICTLGPSCWSEDGLGKLLDAGMNVARFNFSHGTHAAHQEVLDRIRKVEGSLQLHDVCTRTRIVA